MSHQRLSTLNSTSAALSANSSWSGEWEAVTNFTSIVCTLNMTPAAVTSAPLRIRVSYAQDSAGSSVVGRKSRVVTGSTKIVNFPVAGRYVQVTVVNPGDARTSFALQTNMHSSKPSTTLLRNQTGALDDADDAKLVKVLGMSGTTSQLFGFGGSTDPYQAITTEGPATVAYERAQNTVTVTTLSASGTLKSLVATKATPSVLGGQCLKARISANWLAAPPTTSTGAYGLLGLVSPDDVIAVGYSDGVFGLHYSSTSGQVAHELLTVTGAASGTGNITLTFPEGDVVVAVAASDTTSQVAAKIAASDFTTVNWKATAVGAVVTFHQVWPTTNGSTPFITFTDTGTTGVTASLSASYDGVPLAITSVASSSWNVDAMDGSGPSGITLDPTKINDYEIEVIEGSLGCMALRVRSPIDGQWVDCHRVEALNNSTSTFVRSARMQLGYYLNTGTSPGDNVVTMFGGGVFLCSEGSNRAGTTFGASGGVTAVTTTEKQVLAIQTRAHEVLTGNVWANSHRQVRVLKLTMGTETKAAQFYLRRNPSTAITMAAVDAFSVTNAQGGTVAVGAAPDAVGGTVVATFSVGKDSTAAIDLSGMDISLAPGETLSVSAVVAASTGDVFAGLTWTEE